MTGREGVTGLGMTRTNKFALNAPDILDRRKFSKQKSEVQGQNEYQKVSLDVKNKCRNNISVTCNLKWIRPRLISPECVGDMHYEFTYCAKMNA